MRLTEREMDQIEEALDAEPRIIPAISSLIQEHKSLIEE